jgi:hypothetical protein
VDAVIPSIRDIADPLRRDEALQQMHRVSGVDERVLRQSLERRLAAVGPGRRDGTSRITADAVLAAPDALPVGDILKAVTPVEAELLRLLLLLPDQQLRVADQLGPDQLPSTLARELFRALVLHRAPNDQGVRPPFDLIAFIAGLPDDEVRSLAQAAMALQKPQPEAREVAGLLLDIEDDRIRERSEYIESALAEAERAGDAPTVDQLQREQRQINETRRSIDRRREQTRLLARPVAAAQT